MPSSPRRYRLRLATKLPTYFSSWFPNLASHTSDDDTTVVEGPVADACQLAGIVSAICHRDGEILSIEQLEFDAEPRD